MTYPTPEINNTLDMLKYADDVTGNWLIPCFLIALGVTLYAMTYTKLMSTPKSLLVSTTGCFIFGALFWAGGLLSGQIVVFIMALDSLMLIWAKFSD